MTSSSGKGESSPAARQSRQQSPLRRICKRVTFALIPAVVLLGGAELGLRLWGFRFKPWVLDQDIFVSAGRGQLRTDRQFVGKVPYGFEFCLDQRFDRHKPDGTLRIVMVGGSSVMRLGRAEHLAELLTKRLGKPVEIINMGFSSGGSQRALRSTQEALTLEPDLLMVYTGHNEFYSILTWDAGLDLRIVQWLQKQRLKNFQGDKFSNPRFDAVADKSNRYGQLGDNLKQVVDLCRQQDVPVVMGAVSYNLLVKPAGVDQQAMQQALQWSRDELEKLLSSGKPDARVLFAAGHQDWQQKQYDRALPLLEQANSLSPVPNRADTEINRTIIEVTASNKVELADVDKAIRQQSSGGIPDPNLFDDHCHLNQAGNRILQETFAESILKILAK